MRKILRKIIYIMLIGIILSSNITFATKTKQDITHLRTVAYVPLDDRTVNYDRVIMAGKAMGIKVLVPDTAANPQPNLFATKLDGQPKNSTGLNLGAPDLIVDWLRDVTDNHTIDAYIISADQLMSGGLVGSRLKHNGTDITTELKRLKAVMSIIGDKPLYMFDTIMRLASTNGFNGYTQELYNATRKYGSLKRWKTTTDGTFDMSFTNVINNYNKAPDGGSLDYDGLTLAQREEYLNARRRKFKLNIEINKVLKQYPKAKLYYGVDDSKGRTTIQTNEIDYLKVKEGVHDNRIIAGVDEMGMSLLPRCLVDQSSTYGLGKVKVPQVKISYYGGGQNLEADTYDYNTLDSGIRKHILMSGGQIVISGHDMEVLVLTQPKGTKHSKNVNDLHWKINNNAIKNIPTVVIDASLNRGELQRVLFNNTNTPKLLAYSSWNTVGNMTGLAIGHGIGRLAFISLGDKGTSTINGLQGQVKLLYTELATDVSYFLGSKDKVDEYLGQVTGVDKELIKANFYTYNVKEGTTIYNNLLKEVNTKTSISTDNEFSMRRLNTIFCSTSNRVFKTYKSPTNCSFTQIKWINYPGENGTQIRQITYPWHRSFEVRFPLAVSFN